MSILHTDADNIWDIGMKTIIMWCLSTLDNMIVRLRLGYNDTELLDFDSLDARFEINYQF